jgi:ABC-type transport system involved in multi-copper enzyme maturation permease subunit
MTWLALRLLRPYLIAAASVTAAATAYVRHAAGVVQHQLDRSGTPGCADPNVCYPHGAALDAVLGMELCAAFVPALLGLILGVALFAREREDDTIAFALTQSISRRRWVLTKFGWALAAGAVCSAAVAVTHRLVAMRYTALASDTYEMLQLLHLNNIAYMMAQTLIVIALGGALGLSTGRTLRTLVLTVIGGPFAVMIAAGVAVMLSYPLLVMTGASGDSLDPLAYLISAVGGAGVIALVLLAPRIGRS